MVEAGQPDLHRPRVVEARVGAEVGREPLGQRRQPLHPLRPVEERRRAGDEQVQTRETAGVDLVDELAQRVEGLVADVAAHPLQRLDLVEHEQQARVAGVAQHGEQPLEEAQRPEVVEVAPDAGRALGGRGHLRLAAHPGDQAIGGGAVPAVDRRAVAAQGLGEDRRPAADVRQPLLQQPVDRRCQRRPDLQRPERARRRGRRPPG